MNCKQVQELLPLYVGRDLEAKRAQMIAAHVQSCAECAAAANQYRETRQLLQEFSPPLFDEAVYAGIRQRVLREIGRESTPSLPNFIANLFRPRLRWAVATALLLAVCVSVLYFIGNRPGNLKNDAQQVAKGGGTVAGPTSSSIKQSKGVPPVGPVKNKGPAGLAGTHRSQQRRAIGGVPDRLATLDRTDPQSMSAQTLPNGRSEPDAAPAGNAAAPDKTLRVEMQTEDPNIRIIWFTPQPTKQDSPNKSSKGI